MIRSLIFLLAITLIGSSCGSVRRLVSPVGTSSARPGGPSSGEDYAVVRPHKGKGLDLDVKGSSNRRSRKMEEQHYYRASHYNIENSNLLQFKYSIFMNVPVEALMNADLLNYMDSWYGTPYQYGGSTKKGVDCSAFSCGLLSSVFAINIPRTVREQYQASERIGRDDLFEGDLVFFNTRGGISHVGVYLANDKFIHASASGGVMISDLNDAYFERRYVGAGRVRR